MHDLKAGLFTSLGRVSAVLPRFRGKTHVFLLLFNALGLGARHVLVNAELRRPIRYRARLDLHSWLQRIAFLTGEYEADTAAFLVRLHRSLGRAGFVLDVGANIGLVSIPTALLLRQSNGHGTDAPCVVSVEPVSDNCRALRSNISLNDAEEVIAVLDAAVGDAVKRVEIQVEGDLQSGEGTGTANIMAEGSDYDCVRISIELTTLDRLFASGRITASCPVMKLDTDGYDLKALEGGIEFLRQARPTIFGEFSAHCLRWHDQSLADVLRLATELDYLVWPRVSGVELAFAETLEPGSFAQDLLLVPSESADRLEWCLRT